MADHTPEDLGKAYRVLAALIITVLVASAVTVGVRASYGAFSKDFRVSGVFPQAGQALKPGSDVKYRGVTVGKVRSIVLVDRHARITLTLHQGTKVPKRAAATVRPKTLFGEKYIDLSYQGGDAGPYLADGDHLASTATSEEVEGFVSGLDRLFRGVDKTELATLMTELTQAATGEGDRVAHSIVRGVAASNVLSDTLDAQLTALDSFDRFTREYRAIAPDLNGIGTNLNRFLPVFNQARADFEHLLVTLRPFADNLADLLVTNEPDIDRILADGDNIVRVVIARKQDLADVIYGASRYAFKFATAQSKERLADGSRLGYFKLFVDVGDVRSMICSILSAPVPDPHLAQLRDVLGQANPLLRCPASKAAGGSTPAGSGGRAGAPPSAPTPQQRLSQDALANLAQAQAQRGGPGVLSSLFSPLLGGGS